MPPPATPSIPLTSPYHPSRSRFPYYPNVDPSRPPPNSYISFPAGYLTGQYIVAASGLAFHIPTGRLVVVYDSYSKWWFLPKGRKDVGESVEVAAVRESFEESGYQGKLLPYPLLTRQPTSTGRHVGPHTEPLYIHFSPFHSREGLASHLYPCPGVPPKPPSLYMLHYFVLELEGEDPKRAEDWRSRLVGKHEQGYESHLVDVHQAVGLLSDMRFEYKDGKLRVAARREVGSFGYAIGQDKNPDDEWEDLPEWEGYNGLKPGEEVKRENVPACDTGALEALLTVEAWNSINGLPRVASIYD